MPLLPTPHYRPLPPFTNGHVQTLFPTLLRRTPRTQPRRERLELPDGDFLDIDWHTSDKTPTERLAIVSHGLEGHSQKKYPLGMAKHLTECGWDVICLNFRGCSGEPNRLPRLYHSGVTDDLHRVIEHGARVGNYATIALIGFSMGGNQTLKYLGESPEIVPAAVKAAVTFSVPCELADAVSVMNGSKNRIYMEYFMKGLSEKVRIKARMFPDLVDTEGLAEMKTFDRFDEKYTAALHGFSGAADYYTKSSSRQFFPSIRIPTLLVQAVDDPFLSPSCYPHHEADQSPFLFLETPRYGGHVGFVGRNLTNLYWSEQRTAEFLTSVL